jgi:threonine dehydratase
MKSDTRLSLDEMAAAAETIDPVFLHTPQFISQPLSEELGLRLLVKIETLNPIRSFKGRGADFLMSRLAAGEKHLVCASAGNFGQGLAYAARRRRVALDVFAATTANPLKIERMRALGARVLMAGRDFDEAKDAAKAHALRHGLRYIEDGREPAISEGAGTIAIELLRWPEPLDAVIVPLGNGALLSGVGTWCKAHSPATRIIGVCMTGAPAMEQSWRARQLIQTNSTRTIADGIAVRVPVPEALQDLQSVVDDVWLIEDDDLLPAMRQALSTLGVVLEPAGAAGLAAAMKQRDLLAGQTVATVLCGGNLTDEYRRRWLI